MTIIDLQRSISHSQEGKEVASVTGRVVEPEQPEQKRNGFNTYTAADAYRLCSFCAKERPHIHYRLIKKRGGHGGAKELDSFIVNRSLKEKLNHLDYQEIVMPKG